MPRSPIAPLLIAAGVVLILAGLLAWGGLLSWFGRLPGDLRVERPGFRLYAPIVSMLVVSVVLTVVLTAVVALVRRFWP